ncbi:GreA/GreB family elongation factor [Paenibacillus xylanexedens]|uniref:GreA/GreB family elongation factor n=1 Tax=Paenibacillus xylanexedens TaxID=528191 RepID=UPI0011A11292|nr:GreA/GreB family elongation factor [Paenibacillus xylanexedens]
MNHRSHCHNCREMLVSQLITLGEEKKTFLNAYFDVREPEWFQMERMLTTYTEHVEQLLLGSDELLNSTVLIGSRITFEYVDFHTSDSFWIVMPEEADADESRISFLSPVGRQLLLARQGETRSVNIPAGSMRVRITDIQLQHEPVTGKVEGGADYAL